MSVDLATIGLKVDASQVDQGINKLNNLADAGDNAETSTNKLHSATREFNSSLNSTVAAANNASNALNAEASAATNAKSATQGAASSVDNMADEVARLRASINPLAAAIDGVNAEMAMAENLFARGAITAGEFGDAQAILAMRSEMLHSQQSRTNAIMLGTASAAKLSSHEMLNLGRQFQDVGVSFAMGMNPMMIMAQQGPQIFDVLSTRAALSGTTISAVFRQVGVTVYAALAPVLPLIVGISAATAAVASAFAIATREINDDTGSITDSLGLTEKQLERVKASGVSTTVTLGDSFKAFFQVTGDRLTEAFAGPLKWLGDAFEATYVFVRDGGYATIKALVGGFVGGYMAIKTAWSALPAAIGDVAIQSANYVIEAVERMVNSVVARINGLLTLANKGASILGMDGFGMLSNASLGRLDNPNAGAARRATADVSAAARAGYASGSGSVDRFFDDVGDRAGQNRRDAILEAAGKGDTANAGSKAKGASDQAKELEKLTKAAEDFAAALREETGAIGKNRIELKMAATERAALAAPTEALAKDIREAALAWKSATFAEETKKLRLELSDLNAEASFENSLLAMNSQQRAIANAERQIELKLRALERQGIEVSTEAIAAETEALIANARASMSAISVVATSVIGAFEQSGKIRVLREDLAYCIRMQNQIARRQPIGKSAIKLVVGLRDILRGYGLFMRNLVVRINV